MITPVKNAFTVCPLGSSLVCQSQASDDLASRVDPFIGTSTNPIRDNGNTIPGAATPFGMLYWSPDNPDGTFYRYGDTTTRGFSLNYLSGAGCGTNGEIPILSILGIPQTPPPQYPLTYKGAYKPGDQKAEPGYYSVKFESGINVRLAAAPRSGIAELLYPAGGQDHTLLVDLSRNLSRVTDAQVKIQGKEITGSVDGGWFCSAENHYRIFFVIETEQVPDGFGTFDEIAVKPSVPLAKGRSTGAYITFVSTVRACTSRLESLTLASQTQD
ncbi:Alpha-1,2-mannosidase [Acidisarcina polymorpha]|uniref:Alpha-1,2-mannosidase n=1 Tax=Acidisarcina polymorpha TaxID=2211140 RepID=A0A2Z5G457_9BACT|nr:hypothetical protein [Acidisarcina polymorpha]AXC13922.1 Alpha-1,2-mannosidase [Acidisarcina polymorpha]